MTPEFYVDTLLRWKFQQCFYTTAGLIFRFERANADFKEYAWDFFVAVSEIRNDH